MSDEATTVNNVTIAGTPVSAPAVSWLGGGGQMGALMRVKDWSKTPLGPVESWSPALLTVTSILLANRFPMLLWWGPDSISIYNDAYIPVLGTKHPGALGLPVHECWSEIYDVLRPLILAPLTGGPPTWSDDLPLEIRRHGFLEETHWTIAYSPVPDSTVPNGIGGVLATVHEITAQVVGRRRNSLLSDLGSAEAATAEAACATAASVFNRYPHDVPFVLIYLLDRDARTARLVATAGVEPGGPASPSVIDLTAESDANGWCITEAVRTETAQLVEDLGSRFTNVPRGPWPDRLQRALVMPIGSHLAHQLAGVLVVGLSPRLELEASYRGFLDLATARLATAIARARAFEEERRRAESLAELDRAKTAFFSNVSHEFRTPLTLLLGPVEEGLQDATDPLSPGHRQRQETVHRNALRLLKLVNSLLEFSRIEAGRIQASYEPTDIATLTAEVASAFRSLVTRAGLKLTIDCPRVTQPVFVDRQMWEKIVLNLLSNAFKFTLEGEIVVVVEAHPQFVRLIVRDTGIGIDEEHLPHIFERFYRVEGARGRTYEGTGIGLALVRELTRLHGGSASVASELGRGTTFTVTVPTGSAHLPQDRVQAPPTLASTAVGAQMFVEEAAGWVGEISRDSADAPFPETARDECASTGLTRLLVADDNADMRAYLGRLLRPLGTVEMVRDGQEALAAIERRMPDLVLSDVMMPNLDGLGLLRAMRADPRTQALPVVLLSARAGEESRIEGASVGADDYIVKPFSARELVSRVRSQLQLARQRREHAEELRKSEEKYRNLFTNIAEEVQYWQLVRDEAGHVKTWRLVDINPAGLKRWGKTRAETIGKTADEMNPGATAHFMPIVMKTFAEGAPYSWESHFPALDHFLKMTSVPLGEYFITTGADITVLKKSEEALRKSEERYRSLVEQAVDGIITADPTGRCLDANSSGTKMLGFTLEELRQLSITDVIVPEEASRMSEQIATLNPGDVVVGEWRFRRRDDSTFPGEVVGRRLSDGRLLGILRDITERKRAEEATRLSEFATFFSRSGVAMSIARMEDGRHLEVNERWGELFGYRREEVVGHTSSELALWSIPEQRDDLFALLSSGRVVQDVELRMRKQSGENFVGLLSGRVIQVAGDEVILSSFLDITDRKRAEQALLEAHHRKDEFLAALSHELRNPLAPIANSLYVLDHAPPDSAQAQRAKQIIHRQVAHLSNIVNDLLDVTRIVRGKVELKTKLLELNELVRRTVEDNRSIFEHAGVQVKVLPAPGPVMLHADDTRLAQIVGNLLQNSAKFTSKDGHACVFVGVEGREAFVRVVDDGVGMSCETLDRLFEPFSQAKQTLDRSKGGLGLGLALVKGLVELHGGTVSARSEGLGRGTEIIVRLPVNTQSAPEAAP
jgi:PAS domain S-box-containing protein